MKKSTVAQDKLYFNHLLCIVICLTLSACATGYYKNRGITGGYSDTQLAPDMFRVSFSGNGFVSNERAQDMALLRAADLTLMHGYKYFIVGGESDTSTNQTVSTPGHSYTTGFVSMNANSASYSGQTTYFPGMNINIYRAGHQLLIQCLNHRPDSTMTFDARFIMKTLKAKYKVEDKPSSVINANSNGSSRDERKAPTMTRRHAGETIFVEDP